MSEQHTANVCYYSVSIGEQLKIPQHLNITVSHVIPSYETQTCTFDNINNYSTTKVNSYVLSFLSTELLC